MQDNKLSSSITSVNVIRAAKWSTFTEVVTKLVTPISSIILARLLAPEIFGIVASITTITSFCEIFTDAGFQKYIIQKQVKNDDELNTITSVAFWTNLILSITIWAIISIFSSSIAKLVGCEGHGLAVVISSLLLPIHALSSIPSALLKREMDFKSLFYVRLIAISTPFLITLPIAYFTHTYWALIGGNLFYALLATLVIFYIIDWKPQFNYSISKLKEMLSFSVWSMLEAILVWIINWGDVFIVTFFLSNHYLGIYKTSMSMMNSVVAVISSSLSPVMLSSLSKVQNSPVRYKEIFYKISYYSGMLLLPLGAGLFIYKDLVCQILLGKAWSEGATLMGIWGFVSAIAILFNTYNGCVYISMGKPKISTIVQLLQIIIIVPAVYFSVQINFECLSYTRSLIRIVGMFLQCMFVWKLFSISAGKTISDLVPSIIATITMGLFGYWITSLNLHITFEIASIAICVCIYCAVLLCFKNQRERLLAFCKANLINKMKK